MIVARDILTAPLLTVPPEMPVLEFARALDERHLTGAAVVDPSGGLIGVVTESDLIDQHKKLHLPTLITLFDSVLSFNTHSMDEQIKKMVGATVADIMTSKPVTVEEETPLEEIATIMSEEKKHLIPVLKEGRLVGLVDRSQVIHALVKEGGARKNKGPDKASV